ncbi:MAG: type VI secretion system tip protein VgrG [Alphaproteobacteria bacterium]|nr:type VI secretion system tip protein VgrG [Alphaproteobacteria bacterium]
MPVADFDQDTRILKVRTPLGEDVLAARNLSVEEGLSMPFDMELEGFLQVPKVAPSDIVGHPVGCDLTLKDGGERHFHGYAVAMHDRLGSFRLRIVPWLWFLGLERNSRIFQNMTAKNIIQQVFRDKGFGSHADLSGIKGGATVREYCVQWQESDFDFVSRLMEEEGIFYFFRHEKDQHVMVLADGLSAYKKADEAEIEYTGGSAGAQTGDHLWAWEHRHAFRTGRFEHTDFNFETPSEKLNAAVTSIVRLRNADNFTRFEYPGRYAAKGPGRDLAKIRMEEEEAGYDTAEGAGGCRTLAPARTFQFRSTDFPVDDRQEFVVTRISHQVAEGSYVPGGPGGETGYSNSFQCMPSKVLFRPPRQTPKPRIPGSQTAIVTGASGDDILVDKYGRIKVQFHWDRYGKNDEKSSCWIRVAQGWAGKNWGAFFWPRVGQEVVVSFLDGDPDRPLVIGSVYNAEQMPPYALAGAKTRSGVKTRSEKGGTEDFNELRFEDKPGSEEVYFHAQKDFNRRVEHDDGLKVENEQTIEVKNDQSITITNGNRTIRVSMGKISEEAKQSIELKVGASSIKIDPMSITIKAATVTIQGTGKIQQSAPMVSISADAVLTARGGVVKIN